MLKMMVRTHQVPIEDGVCAQPIEGDVLTGVLHSSCLELGEYCFLTSAQKKVLKALEVYFPKG
jgi:hypothetical protein